MKLRDSEKAVIDRNDGILRNITAPRTPKRLTRIIESATPQTERRSTRITTNKRAIYTPITTKIDANKNTRKTSRKRVTFYENPLLNGPDQIEIIPKNDENKIFQISNSKENSKTPENKFGIVFKSPSYSEVVSSGVGRALRSSNPSIINQNTPSRAAKTSSTKIIGSITPIIDKKSSPRGNQKKNSRKVEKTSSSETPFKSLPTPPANHLIFDEPSSFLNENFNVIKIKEDMEASQMKNVIGKLGQLKLKEDAIKVNHPLRVDYKKIMTHKRTTLWDDKAKQQKNAIDTSIKSYTAITSGPCFGLSIDYLYNHGYKFIQDMELQDQDELDSLIIQHHQRKADGKINRPRDSQLSAHFNMSKLCIRTAGIELFKDAFPGCEKESMELFQKSLFLEQHSEFHQKFKSRTLQNIESLKEIKDMEGAIPSNYRRIIAFKDHNPLGLDNLGLDSYEPDFYKHMYLKPGSMFNVNGQIKKMVHPNYSDQPFGEVLNHFYASRLMNMAHNEKKWTRKGVLHCQFIKVQNYLGRSGVLMFGKIMHKNPSPLETPQLIFNSWVTKDIKVGVDAEKSDCVLLSGLSKWHLQFSRAEMAIDFVHVFSKFSKE